MKKTKKVRIGNVIIGGGESVAVQSMTNTLTADVKATVSQINGLTDAGAKIVRVAVRDEADAKAIKEIKKSIICPIVADIHFDYRLAIKSIEAGADKIRINPGNIGSDNNVEAVASALKDYGIPVRVGSNSGSIEKEYLEKYGRTKEALAESALSKVALLEKFGVENIVVAAKSSNVPLMVSAYEYLSEKTDYPLHIGVTEAGTAYSGTIKGAVGIGALLLKGIGDTVRVSLSAPPKEEVRVAYSILRAIGLDKNYVEVVACPTCGRCDYDCIGLAKKIEEVTQNIHKPLKVAVMGCVVNGIGESEDCDIGVAGGKEKCVIFKDKKPLRTVPSADIEREFTEEIEKCLKEIRN